MPHLLINEKVLNQYKIDYAEDLKSVNLRKLYNNIFTFKDNDFFIVKHFKNSEKAETEARTLYKLQGEGVPLLIGQNDDIVVMEKCKGKDLFEHFCSYPDTNEEKLIKQIMFQVIEIIYNIYMKYRIFHGDIKPENIIYDDDNHKIKIIDWELVRHTKEYMAPENEKNIESDVYSLGITFYQLLNTEIPEDIHNLSFTKNVSKQCQKLINRMLDPNPKTRIKIKELYEHNYFSS